MENKLTLEDMQRALMKAGLWQTTIENVKAYIQADNETYIYIYVLETRQPSCIFDDYGNVIPDSEAHILGPLKPLEEIEKILTPEELQAWHDYSEARRVMDKSRQLLSCITYGEDFLNFALTASAVLGMKFE